jgi:hypothetical protein
MSKISMGETNTYFKDGVEGEGEEKHEWPEGAVLEHTMRDVTVILMSIVLVVNLNMLSCWSNKKAKTKGIIDNKKTWSTDLCYETPTEGQLIIKTVVVCTVKFHFWNPIDNI